MAAPGPHNVEFEAAKFLQKLIHESTDEPSKLATKLYVILQHMKASGKENSMPYQVISRAMETVINQHGLDIEALMASRLPMSNSTPGEAARAQVAGSSQTVAASESDSARTDGFGSSKPPSVPTTVGHDTFQGSVSQRGGKSFDHESPSSMDTRSTNSHSLDRRDTASWEQQGTPKDPSRASIKRKRSDSSTMEPPDDSMQQNDSHTGMPDMRKERIAASKLEVPGNYSGGSEGWKQGFKGAPSFRETAVPGHLFSQNQGDGSMVNLNSASRLNAAGMQTNLDRLLQSANPSQTSEVGALRGSAPRDTGKALAVPTMVSNLPFKEHHLKQLRAQCLVYLAFRNGLSPKRIHLEIALGNIFPREGTSGTMDGSQGEITSDKGKQPPTLESSSTAEVGLPHGNLGNVKFERSSVGTVAAGCVPETDAIGKEPENLKIVEEKRCILADSSLIDAGSEVPPGEGILKSEQRSQEMANSSAVSTTALQPDISGVRSPTVRVHVDNLLADGATHAAYVMGMNKQLKPEMMRWAGVAHNDLSRGALPASLQHDVGNRKDGSSSLSQLEGDIANLQHADSHLATSSRAKPENDANLLKVAHRGADDSSALDARTKSATDMSNMVPVFDSSYVHNDQNLALMEKISEPEEEDKLVSAGLASSPKYTLSEKWIMAHQKRKVINEQKWHQKLQKADLRIAACFSELKETVRSSEDISAKTRSVIELKKLQLLELQRRLRSNIVNDFFKPIQTEMDRLKSIKKHRIGRRMKHVEKYEQKMKEERQKRIRERQKEFFSEIEVHKERLEDVFKFKRERCKGFNRYVKEFHKRKERIHREKIDRIQREKINLLKINDVEGYLRMVQDAKSDRVKQLLKETEKYLQKLGSKLQQAKSSARQVEMDENRTATADESCEFVTETEDENDQAKHYKESNEKYYLIAHSIKENITEQPAGLQGGKLREYQMNGLRWLVSLYNNHLNGILADEMGLGKTVQVISLLCYLMEAKNDRGPFLVVVPSSVLPGWEQEMSFWAPGINKIVYTGSPEERRRLFKENIVHQTFNVLLTTYEYLMNKHDRPKLSKIHWHYVIIDEGHRIKNASCKLNADLKHYHSSHRLLLTGTPLQNSLEELWALLNFLLPNIFNSSEDFSQWFNKPFESNGDNSPDEALLSEEENLLIINRLHQVLRPFVLRRLKHKVENELPEKIERLVRCEASAYQKLLMKRVEENLGSLGVSKGRAVHNSVMELRNICNHPYLSQLHSDEVDNYIPKHFLPPIVRLCGKLEMLDRLLPKLKATNHRVLFFSTMTRLLDIMEEYLVWKQYRYLRLDGHTSGQDRGGLIDKFNQPDSPFFIFLLSIRAGGVGVNLQAADTVIIFDTDWNPQVDLQAQARAHRIGQKKDVLVLRLETVKSVEEQVRAAAEHKLGVANQSITAGFFDNNTSAEDRREYLESLLRECKKEEATPVLDDDSLNDILARSESEIDVFEAVDQKRREDEMATWKTLALDHVSEGSEATPPLPSRLVTDDDLKTFYEAMRILEAPVDESASSCGVKRKSGSLGGFDTRQYGRGKRAREVRSYEEQWTEEEFEKMCQAESPDTPKPKDEKIEGSKPLEITQTAGKAEIPLQSLQTPPAGKVELPLQSLQTPADKAYLPLQSLQTPPFPLESPALVKKEVSPPAKRGRGRPKRTGTDVSASLGAVSTTIGVRKPESQPLQETVSSIADQSRVNSQVTSTVPKDPSLCSHQVEDGISPSPMAVQALSPSLDVGAPSGSPSISGQPKRQGRKGQPREKFFPGQSATETARRRGRKPTQVLPPAPAGTSVQESKPYSQHEQPSSDISLSTNMSPKGTLGNSPADGVVGTSPSDVLAVEGLETSETAGSHVSSDVLLKNEAPITGKKASESIEQSVKQALVDSIAVGSGVAESSDLSKANPVSQDISVSRSVGSSALPVGGSSPPTKVGADLQIVGQQTAIGSSEYLQGSSIGLRPGRRQNQKHQNTAEPVRRRGRKRGQSVPVEPVQEQNSEKLLKSTGSVAPPTVSYIVPTGGAVKFEMGSHVATVPIITPGSVSRIMPSSISATGVSSSMQFINTGSVASNLSTQQPNPCLSATPDILSGTLKAPVPLLGQGLDQRVQGGETVPRRRGRKKGTALPAGLDHSVSQLQGKSDRKSDDIIDRKVIATRSRQMNTSQSSPHVTGHSGGASASAITKEAKASVTPTLSNLFFASPCNEKFIPIKEPRQGGAVEEIKLFHKPADFPPISCKGKTNVIVLALESTADDIDLSGIDGVTHEIVECTEPQNKSVSSVPVLKPEVSGLNLSDGGGDATKLDEELSAPPGFEMPRPSVSDFGVRRLQESDDGEMSASPDAKRGSVVLALESASQMIDPSTESEKMSEKEESLDVLTIRTSGQGTSVPLNSESCLPIFRSTADVSIEDDMAAPPGFDTPQQCLSTSVAAKDYECHDQASERSAEPGSADPLIAPPVLGCQTAAASTVDSREQEQSHSPDVVGSDAAEPSSLQSKEGQQSHGPDMCNIKSGIDAPISSDMIISGTTTADANPKEVPWGPDDCKAEHDVAEDVHTVSDVVGSDGATVSLLESMQKEDCPGGKNDAVDGPISSNAEECVSKLASALKLVVKGELHELDGCQAEHDDTGDLHAISHDVGSDVVAASSLESIQKADCPGSDPAAVTICESKAPEVSHGPDIYNVERNIVVAMSSDTIVSDTTIASLSKLKEVSPGGQNDTVSESIASNLEDCVSTPVEALDLIEQGEPHDDCKAEHDAGDVNTISLVVSDIAAASALESFQKEDSHGSASVYTKCDGVGFSNAEHEGVDALLTSSTTVPDNMAASRLQTRENEERVGVNSPMTSGAAFSDTKGASSLQTKENDEHIGVNANITSCTAVSDAMAASPLQTNESDERSSIDTSITVSGTMAASPLQTKENDERSGVGVDAPITSSTAVFVTVAASPLHAKESDERSCVDASITAVSGAMAASHLQTKENDERSGVGVDAPITSSAAVSDTMDASPLQTNDADAPITSITAVSDTMAVSPVHAKESDERSCVDASITAVSGAMAASHLQTKENDERSGVGVDAPITSSAAVSDTMDASPLQTNDADAPITSITAVSDTMDASPLQTKDNDERSDADAPITSSTAVSDVMGALPLQTEESDERSCIDASVTAVFGIMAASPLQTKENDERSGVGVVAPITSSTSVSDTLDALPLQTKDSDEHSSADAAVNSSTAVSDTVAVSPLLAKENDEGSYVDALSTSSLEVLDTVVVSPLQTKENEERSGVDASITSSNAVSDTVAASPLQTKENEERSGVDAPSAANNAVLDAVIASPLQAKENEERSS